VQVCEYKEVTMNRDMDLVRELLLFVERDPRLNGTAWMSPRNAEEMGITGHSIEEINYHLTMLVEAGFLLGRIGPNYPAISRMTWQGHEFLDDIKDVGIWEKTKARLDGLPSVALTVVAEIAKAEIKKKLGLS
jgi:Hypothetical protein (DUF2513)